MELGHGSFQRLHWCSTWLCANTSCRSAGTAALVTRKHYRRLTSYMYLAISLSQPKESLCTDIYSMHTLPKPGVADGIPCSVYCSSWCTMYVHSQGGVKPRLPFN